ncbi:MAG: hypothetical protein OXG10_08935 [Candidatus Dadabacteria bacterium]|nr:hypothetical protein [Candidatus Dadabacteria bacterium]
MANLDLAVHLDPETTLASEIRGAAIEFIYRKEEATDDLASATSFLLEVSHRNMLH